MRKGDPVWVAGGGFWPSATTPQNLCFCARTSSPRARILESRCPDLVTAGIISRVAQLLPFPQGETHLSIPSGFCVFLVTIFHIRVSSRRTPQIVIQTISCIMMQQIVFFSGGKARGDTPICTRMDLCIFGFCCFPNFSPPVFSKIAQLLLNPQGE